MLQIKNKVVSIKKQLPIIGCAYAGKPIQFIDGRRGEYWESMPALSYMELKIQRSLLKKD